MVENDRVTTIPPRLRPLLDAGSPVHDLAGRLGAGGHQCYLVGGSVRDAFLDLAPDDKRDVDVATDARPDEVERVVRAWAMNDCTGPSEKRSMYCVKISPIPFLKSCWPIFQ